MFLVKIEKDREKALDPGFVKIVLILLFEDIHWRNIRLRLIWRGLYKQIIISKDTQLMHTCILSSRLKTDENEMEEY